MVGMLVHYVVHNLNGLATASWRNCMVPWSLGPENGCDVRYRGGAAHAVANSTRESKSDKEGEVWLPQIDGQTQLAKEATSGACVLKCSSISLATTWVLP